MQKRVSVLYTSSTIPIYLGIRSLVSPDGSKGALRENSWAENVKYETEYVAATDCYSALTEEKPRRSAEGIAKTIHDWFTECSVLTVCVKSHIVRGFDVLVQFFGPIEGMGSW